MYHARVPGASHSVYGRVVDEVPHYTLIPLKIPFASGTRGEAGGAGTAAAPPSGAVWGGVAPHSRRRGAITPTPRQRGRRDMVSP